MDTASKAGVVRFGVFEFDPQTGILNKRGLRVKVEAKPLQVLALLVERAGELATQEQIRERLWPDGTVVEFEHSIKTAVKKLRGALGDDADTPRYIETLPRRGYRFIYPVTGPGAYLAPGPGGRASGVSLQRRLIWLLGMLIAVFALVAFFIFVAGPLPAPKVLRTTQITHDGRDKLFGTQATNVPPFPLVTDGARVCVAEGTGIAEVSTTGGQTVMLPSSFPFSVPSDIAPDKDKLSVSKEWIDGPIGVLPLPSGPVHQIGDLVGHDATWSPDGREITYARKNEIYIAKDDGTESRRLAVAPGWVTWLRRSPNGRLLRFTVWEARTSSKSLWEVRADGTGLQPLLTGWNPPKESAVATGLPMGDISFSNPHVMEGRTSGLGARSEDSLVGEQRTQCNSPQGA